MSDAAPLAPRSAGRDRSRAARQASRQRKAERERRIVDLLNRGLSVAEIAAREGITPRGMRKATRAILARPTTEAAFEFIARRRNRLHEALNVSFSAMSGENLGAIDRVVKIVRELDRYHGFAGAGALARPRPSRPAPPSLSPPEVEAEPNGAASL